MRGLLTDRTAQVIIAGHAFMQNGSGTNSMNLARRD
jgi:hypothetical protein